MNGELYSKWKPWAHIRSHSIQSLSRYIVLNFIIAVMHFGVFGPKHYLEFYCNFCWPVQTGPGGLSFYMIASFLYFAKELIPNRPGELETNVWKRLRDVLLFGISLIHHSIVFRRLSWYQNVDLHGKLHWSLMCCSSTFSFVSDYPFACSAK